MGDEKPDSVPGFMVFRPGGVAVLPMPAVQHVVAGVPRGDHAMRIAAPALTLTLTVSGLGLMPTDDARLRHLHADACMFARATDREQALRDQPWDQDGKESNRDAK